MKKQSTLTIIIIAGMGSLLATSACGLVTIETSGGSTPSQTNREPVAKSSAAPERVDARDVIERELLPSQLSTYGGPGDFETAERIFKDYKESKGKAAGDRLPSELMLVRLRRYLRGTPAARKSEALAMYKEARALATDVPPWAGEEDESASEDFRSVIGGLGKVVDAARGRAYQELEPLTEAFAENYKQLHPKTPRAEARAKAIATEVAQIKARFDRDVERFKAARARLERDAEYNRLADEQSRLEDETGTLQQKLGLTSYDTGCDKRSADPIDRQRLAALCPRMTRLHAVIARRFAIEERYLKGIWPDKPAGKQ